MNPSGLRIGTPALTTRGLVEEDMREIAEVIAVALSERFESEREALAERTRSLMERYPLYPQLSATRSSSGRRPRSRALRNRAVPPPAVAVAQRERVRARLAGRARSMPPRQRRADPSSSPDPGVVWRTAKSPPLG